jgi:hypothetical protein
MKLIMSIETENRVIDMLSRGVSDREIRKAGVSYNSLVGVKRMLETVKGMNQCKLREVRRLLSIGYPVNAVAIKTTVPVSEVLRARRFFRLQSRVIENVETECPVCGKKKNDNTRVKFVTPTASEVAELVDVADDISSLSDLKIIKSVLFNQIAEKTKKVLEKIDGRTEAA